MQPLETLENRRNGLQDRPFLNTNELAERWQCSKMHIYRLVEANELTATKIGKLLRFRFEDVLEYELRNTSEAA